MERDKPRANAANLRGVRLGRPNADQIVNARRDNDGVKEPILFGE
jgi:hypothetical protein